MSGERVIESPFDLLNLELLHFELMYLFKCIQCMIVYDCHPSYSTFEMTVLCFDAVSR